MPVTVPSTTTERPMPHTTPHRRDCTTCPVALLSTMVPFLGTVRAGEPTTIYDPAPDDVPRDDRFRGYSFRMPESYLTREGIASGDTLWVSTHTPDLVLPERHIGRIVIAIDRDGTSYIGRLQDGVIRDDRGTLDADGLTVVGLIAYVVRVP